LRQADARLRHASGELENLQALHENIIQSISGGIITAGLDGRVQVPTPPPALCWILSLPPSSASPSSLFLEPCPTRSAG